MSRRRLTHGLGGGLLAGLFAGFGRARAQTSEAPDSRVQAQHGPASAPPSQAAAETPLTVDPRVEALADAAVTPWMQAQRIDGAVVGLVRQGAPVLVKGYGRIRPGDGPVPDAQTGFCVGSLTKCVTALACLILADEGRLQLDVSASRWLPELPPAWKPVTVRQYLCHASGVPHREAILAPTFAEACRKALSVPILATPGTAYDYNSFNYAVAGQLVERCSGRSYADFVRARILEPLGMAGSDIARYAVAEAAQGCLVQAGACTVPVVAPPGGLYNAPSGWLCTTMADLLRFEGALDARALISEAGWRAIVEPYSATIEGSCGWTVHRQDGRKAVYKNGRASGFSSELLWLPDTADAVILLWNQEAFPDYAHLVTRDLLAAIAPPVPARKPDQPAAPQDEGAKTQAQAQNQAQGGAAATPPVRP